MKLTLSSKPKIFDACNVRHCRNPATQNGLCGMCRDVMPKKVRSQIHSENGGKFLGWVRYRFALKLVFRRHQMRSRN